MDNHASGPDVTVRTDFPGAGSRTWRPAAVLVLGACVLAGLAFVGTALPRDPLDRVVTGLVGAVLLVVAVVGWRRRVVGGPRGLLIGGLSGVRIVPWSMVRSVECGRTKRMGSAMLEIDLVDDELIMFGRLELGTDPADVAAVLTPWFGAGGSRADG